MWARVAIAIIGLLHALIAFLQSKQRRKSQGEFQDAHDKIDKTDDVREVFDELWGADARRHDDDVQPADTARDDSGTGENHAPD